MPDQWVVIRDSPDDGERDVLTAPVTLGEACSFVSEHRDGYCDPLRAVVDNSGTATVSRAFLAKLLAVAKYTDQVGDWPFLDTAEPYVAVILQEGSQNAAQNTSHPGC